VSRPSTALVREREGRADDAANRRMAVRQDEWSMGADTQVRIRMEKVLDRR
jgi:hypothetical protein